MTRNNLIEERLQFWRRFLNDLKGYEAVSEENKGTFERYLKHLAGLPTGLAKGQPTLQKAEEFFGLRATDSIEAAVLLRILAEIVFWTEAKGRPKGKKKWDQEKLFLLGIRAAALKKSRGNRSGNDLAEALKEKFGDYRHVSTETIRQRLPDASQRVEEFSQRLMSRMNELGLSFPEYMKLLAKDFGMDAESLKRASEDAFRSVWGSSVK